MSRIFYRLLRPLDTNHEAEKLPLGGHKGLIWKSMHPSETSAVEPGDLHAHETLAAST